MLIVERTDERARLHLRQGMLGVQGAKNRNELRGRILERLLREDDLGDAGNSDPGAEIPLEPLPTFEP